MRLFLQIDINDWQKRSYEVPLTRFAASLASDIVSADLDNQSEPQVVDLILRLVDQSEEVFVWINAEPDQALGPCTKLLNHLLRTPEKVAAMASTGENKWVEKLTTPFQNKLKIHHDLQSIQKQIERFALSRPADS